MLAVNHIASSTARDLVLLNELYKNTPDQLINARKRLAGNIRDLINAVASSGVDEVALVDVAETILQITGSLSKALYVPGYTRALEGRLTGLGPHGELGPFTGELHAYSSGIKIKISGEEEKKTVKGSVIYGDAFEGAPGLVQGGFIIATFDEILGLAQSGKQRMTASLEVSYRAPAPLHTTLTYCAWIDKVEGRKAFVSGQLLNNEVVCAEAKALFIQPRSHANV